MFKQQNQEIIVDREPKWDLLWTTVAFLIVTAIAMGVYFLEFHPQFSRKGRAASPQARRDKTPARKVRQTKATAPKVRKTAPKPRVVPAKNKAKAHPQKFTTRYHFRKIDKSVASVDALEKWIQPYRSKLKKHMSKVLAKAEKPFTRGRPESSLGNLIADISMERLKLAKIKVDVFITNLGGIRRDLAAGDVSLGTVYEVLPFENALVVVKVSGKILGKAIKRLAQMGGEPIAGAHIVIDRKSKKVISVKVGGKPLDKKASYFLATSDYLAKTGWLSKSLSGLPLRLTGITLRDAMMWGIQRPNRKLIPKLDGRVRYQQK